MDPAKVLSKYYKPAPYHLTKKQKGTIPHENENPNRMGHYDNLFVWPV